MLAPRKKLHSTPLAVIAKAFELANVTPDDVVCDIGCGDGRVLLYAATKLLVKQCIGFEIDAERVKAIQTAAIDAGVDNQIKVYCGNALEMEIHEDVTVLFLFLIERGLRQVFRKLMENTSTRVKELRILTYLYKIDAMDPYLVDTNMFNVDNSNLGRREAAFPIYFYKIPPSHT